MHFDFAASETAATKACDTMLIFAVLQVPGVAPWPVEAGPQFIHGAHSSLQVCAQQFHAYAQFSSWTARAQMYLHPIVSCCCTQELLNDIGCNVDEYDWPNNWYFGQGRRFFGADTEVDPDQNVFSVQVHHGQPQPPETALQGCIRA